jgi:lipopolysaccharide biosynthesis glycosyltransferase
VNTVALFADRWILPGLHVTLASLLDHARDSAPMRLVVFGEQLTSFQRQLVERTAAGRLGRHRLEFRAYATPLAGRVRSLRGNYTTYGRLFLPDLLPDSDACVYLDCDLVVTRPLDPLFALASAAPALHAEGSGVRRDSLDRPTFDALGMPLDAVYFNCGVLALNLTRWRDERLSERCVAFAVEHLHALLSADQTVLNCVLADVTGTFGQELNTFLWPDSPSVPADARTGRIFHFVGAPKPWNWLGRYANANAALWHDWATQTAWWEHWPSRISSRLGVRQELRLARATLRSLRNIRSSR